MAVDKIFGNSLPGYVTGPQGAPAVVLLQEWWGITDEIKQQAVKLSEKGGFRVLIPDLYKGKMGVDAEEAQHLMNNLDFKAAVDEVDQAAAYLHSQGSSKVGVVGFCMGGALAAASAQHAQVVCAAAFYGTPPKELCQPENVKVPLQAHSGSEDSFKGFADPETMGAFVDAVKKAGGDAELFVYEGAAHAFMNEGHDVVDKMKTGGIPKSPDEARQLAWSRVLDFLSKHLK